MTKASFSPRNSNRGSTCVAAFVSEPLKNSSVGIELVTQLKSQSQSSSRTVEPKLFVLWATHDFSPFDALVRDIADYSERLYGWRVPLIGATVSGCMFSGKAHKVGALLLSLQSPELSVKTSKVEFNDGNIRESADDLLRQLSINPYSKETLQPGRQMMMLFVPGYGVGNNPRPYRAAEFVDAVRTITHQRLPLFGGVASIDSSGSIVGHQFVNDSSNVNTVVAAFISSSLPIATGMSHGLVPARLKGVEQSGSSACYIPHGKVKARRVIDSEQLHEIVCSLAEEPVLLRTRGVRDDVVLVPFLEDNKVVVQRDIEDEIVLEALVPDSTVLARSVLKLEKRLRETSGIQREDVDSIMAVGCTARLQWADDERLDKWLESVQRRFRGATHVGCFMDGEIGTDKNGIPSLSNWSLSETFLPKGTPAPRVAQVLNSLLKKPVRTVSEAIDVSIVGLKQMGYCGGMTSLIYEADGRSVIVAKKAFGRFWNRFVLPRTQRPLDGKDVLAIVANEKRFRFVADATTDPYCDRDAARMANINSFLAFPLIDPSSDETSKQVLAVVQVDLGDRRKLKNPIGAHEYEEIKCLATAMSGIIANAVKTEWLLLDERINQAFTEADKEMDADDFATFISSELVEILGATGAHVRLLRDNKLVMAGVGLGSYYNIASKVRPEIDPNTDPSPSAACFRKRKPILRNNVTLEANEFSDARRFLDSESESCIRKELRKHPAFGCIPIVEDESCQPLGVISFTSTKPWSFQQIQITRLAMVARRFASILRRIGAQRALENEQLSESGRIVAAREVLTVGGSTPGW